MRTLNIGMVGYGFMARAHSNAWANVPHFFDTGYRPALKAVAARTRDRAKVFADMWGYERVESDWRRLVEAKDIDADRKWQATPCSRHLPAAPNRSWSTE